MIIDVNATVGQWPFRLLRHADGQGLLKRLKGCGIDKAFVSMLSSAFYKDVQPGNRYVSEQVKDFKDDLIPVAVINPAFPGWKTDYEECFSDLEARGVRLYPNYHDYDLSASCLHELLEMCNEDSRPVWLTVRLADERMHHRLAMVPAVSLSGFEGLAQRFSDVKFILANVKSQELSSLKDAMANSDNIFCEISHIESVNGVAELAGMIGSTHLLFGTWAPFFYPESALLKMRESELTREEAEAIRFGNAQETFSAILGAQV